VAGRSPSAVHESLVAAVVVTQGIDRADNALHPEPPGRRLDKGRIVQCRGVDRDLVGPGRKPGLDVGERADAPAEVSGMKQHGDLAQDVDALSPTYCWCRSSRRRSCPPSPRLMSSPTSSSAFHCDSRSTVLSDCR
jgi:hypothetical protein